MSLSDVIIGAGEIFVDGINMGYTQDGVTITFEKEILSIIPDQKYCTVKAKMHQEVAKISTILLQSSLNAIRMIWGISGSVVSLADGISELNLGCQLVCREPEHEVIFQGPGPDCKLREIKIYKAVSIEAGEHSYIKDDATEIPVVFLAIADMSLPAGQRYGEIVDYTQIDYEVIMD